MVLVSAQTAIGWTIQKILSLNNMINVTQINTGSKNNMLGKYIMRKENPVSVKFHIHVARGTSVCILRHIDGSDVFGLFVSCLCCSVHK